ncbi:hypothetical protein [Streptomyces ardesiacus]|uniref:hypothetical protein n=1 Tax=Streptomyces ardesiacus TaxID=285564 RepID=UPI00365C1255
MSVTLGKCEFGCKNKQPGEFDGGHTTFGGLICDWCAGMWVHDSHCCRGPKVSLVKATPEIPLECSARDWPRNYHFEGKCTSCDAHTLSRLTLGQVEDRYYQGRVSQDQFEAYMWAFDYLSAYRNNPVRSDIPEVRRIARALFRFRAFEIPAGIEG